MALRNATGMMLKVKHTIKGTHEDSNQQQHIRKQNLAPEFHHRLGKRQLEAETNAGQAGSIGTKESRQNPKDDEATLAANQEKELKKAVINALSGVSKPAPMMASSIIQRSSRATRNEIYSLHLSACGLVRLNPFKFSEWLLSKIEEYIAATSTSTTEQAGLDDPNTGILGIKFHPR
jgi:hypothetical protein